MFAVVLLQAGCLRTGEQKRAAVQTMDDAARQYVRLVLALGERDPDSLDFAAVPELLRKTSHERYSTLDEIGRQAATLQQELRGLKENRAQALAEQLESLTARAAMLQGKTLSFDDEAAALFRVRRLPDTQARARSALRQEIQSMLPAGGKGSAADRYAAYDRRFLVPPERLAAVMTAALAACRRTTLRHIALPPRESVELGFVHNQPWSAFSRYQGNGHSTIQVNRDFPVTVDDALELACHEGYPGHHAFNTLREAALVKGRGWVEASVQPTFSPQSYVSEAMAAYAPRLAFSLRERTAVERDVLFPLAGLPQNDAARYVSVCELLRRLSPAEPAIAREYLDGRLEFMRAEEQLSRETLMAHAEALLLYVNEYRSYILAYTDGPRRAAALLGNGSEEQRWRRLFQVMTSPVYRLPEPPS